MTSVLIKFGQQSIMHLYKSNQTIWHN